MHVHIYCSPIVKSSGGDRVIDPIQKPWPRSLKGMFAFIRSLDVSSASYSDMSVHNCADILNTGNAQVAGLVVSQARSRGREGLSFQKIV